MEKDKDGRDIRTQETTVKNSYGDTIQKFKLFYIPNFCIMAVMRCNLSDADRCIPGTVKRWNPGFWNVDAPPLLCPSFNSTTEKASPRLTKRAPRGATCFMKVPENNKKPSSCGSGPNADLLSLKDIADNSGDYSAIAVDNEADLILSRGDGIFNWRDLALDQIFVCKAHYKELGQGWRRRQPRLTKKTDKLGPKCAMPELENVRKHEKPTLAKRNTHLTKSESEAILQIKQVFVSPETGRAFSDWSVSHLTFAF
jgi:hypothetical protein